MNPRSSEIHLDQENHLDHFHMSPKITSCLHFCPTSAVSMSIIYIVTISLFFVSPAAAVGEATTTTTPTPFVDRCNQYVARSGLCLNPPQQSNLKCMIYNGRCVNAEDAALKRCFRSDPIAFCGQITDPNFCRSTRYSRAFAPCFWLRGTCLPICTLIGMQTSSSDSVGSAAAAAAPRVANKSACLAAQHCTLVTKEYSGNDFAEKYAFASCIAKCSIATELASCELISQDRKQHAARSFCSFDFVARTCARECIFFSSNTTCEQNSNGRCYWIPHSATCTERCERAQDSESCFASRSCQWVDTAPMWGTLSTDDKRKFKTGGCFTRCAALPRETCGTVNPACDVSSTSVPPKCAVKRCEAISVDDCELREKKRCMIVEENPFGSSREKVKRCVNRCSQYNSFTYSEFAKKQVGGNNNENNNESLTTTTTAAPKKTVLGCLESQLDGVPLCIVDSESGICINEPNCSALTTLGPDLCSEFSCLPIINNSQSRENNNDNSRAAVIPPHPGADGEGRGMCAPPCARYFTSKEKCEDPALGGKHCSWALDRNGGSFACYVKCSLISGADFAMKPLCENREVSGGRCLWLESEHRCEDKNAVQLDSGGSSSSTATSAATLWSMPCWTFDYNSTTCLAPQNKGRCAFINTSSKLIGCRTNCADFRSKAQCFAAFEFSGCAWDPASCSCTTRCDLRDGPVDPLSCNSASCYWNREWSMCGFGKEYLLTAACNSHADPGRMVVMLLILAVLTACGLYVRRKCKERCSAETTQEEQFGDTNGNNALVELDTTSPSVRAPDGSWVRPGAAAATTPARSNNDDDDQQQRTTQKIVSQHNLFQTPGPATATAAAAGTGRAANGGRPRVGMPVAEWSPPNANDANTMFMERKNAKNSSVDSSDAPSSSSTPARRNAASVIDDIFSGVAEVKRTELPAAWKTDAERLKQKQEHQKRAAAASAAALGEDGFKKD